MASPYDYHAAYTNMGQVDVSYNASHPIKSIWLNSERPTLFHLVFSIASPIVKPFRLTSRRPTLIQAVSRTTSHTVPIYHLLSQRIKRCDSTDDQMLIITLVHNNVPLKMKLLIGYGPTTLPLESPSGIDLFGANSGLEFWLNHQLTITMAYHAEIFLSFLCFALLTLFCMGSTNGHRNVKYRASREKANSLSVL